MTRLEALRYRTWRATVPWSDAEIAAAFEAEADRCASNRGGKVVALRLGQALEARAGRLTRGLVEKAADLLVRVCDVCGAAAVYRSGFSGRCSAHRDIEGLGQYLARVRKDLAHAAYCAETTEFERAERARLDSKRNRPRPSSGGGRGARRRAASGYKAIR